MMNGRIRIGRIIGIQVNLSWSVLIIAGFYVYILATYQFPNQVWGARPIDYWVAGTAGAIVFFLSLLIHEMSHALVARRSGIGVRGITLWLLGGYAELETEARTPGQQFAIAVVGPLSNLTLGVLFWIAHRLMTGTADVFSIGFGTGDIAGMVVGWLAFVNFLLGAFNLIPAAPLDGGQLFGAGLWAATGDRTIATKWASYAGVALGSAGVAYGLTSMNASETANGIWFMIIGWWIMSVAFAELKRIRYEVAFGPISVQSAMRANPPIVPADITIDTLIGPGRTPSDPGAYCVQEPDGRITGVLTARQIHDCDPQSRARVALRHLAFPIARVKCIAADEKLLVAARQIVDDPISQALVLQADGRVVGLLAMDDINNYVRNSKV